MASGTGSGMGTGLGTGIFSSSASKKSTGRTSAGKKSTGRAVGGAGRQTATRSTGTGGGQKPLVNMSQLLSGQGGGIGMPGARMPGGGMPGAGAPTGIPGIPGGGAGVPGGGMPANISGLPTTPGDPSQYDFGMQNMGDLATLDLGSEARTPTSYISGRAGSQVGSVGEQDVTDFYNKLTMSKLENLSPEERTAFDERMVGATKRKESLRWPGGIDPELMEQRITAAESEKWPNSADFFKELRSSQTEPTALQNVGSMLKTGAKGIGGYLENLGQSMGVYQKPLWPSSNTQREGWVRQDIMGGRGTPVDQNKAYDFIKNKRAENYAAGITVPPGKEYIAPYMRGGEERINQTPYGMKFVNAPDLLVPPKPSTYEAPRKTSVSQPQPSQSVGYDRYSGGGRVNLLSRMRQHRKEDEEIERKRLLMAMGRFNPEATHELPAI